MTKKRNPPLTLHRGRVYRVFAPEVLQDFRRVKGALVPKARIGASYQLPHFPQDQKRDFSGRLAHGKTAALRFKTGYRGVLTAGTDRRSGDIQSHSRTPPHILRPKTQMSSLLPCLLRVVGSHP